MTIPTAIADAFRLLPAMLDTAPARVMLIATGAQESNFEARRQLITVNGRLEPRGPAAGYWQFEQGGGVAGVLRHPQSRELARWVCLRRGVDPTPATVWAALERDDVLGAGFARLLLWTDPAPLPRVGDEAGAWDLYLRTWRPGAYTRGTPATQAALAAKWAANYRAAVEAVGPSVDQAA